MTASNAQNTLAAAESNDVALYNTIRMHRKQQAGPESQTAELHLSAPCDIRESHGRS